MIEGTAPPGPPARTAAAVERGYEERAALHAAARARARATAGRLSLLRLLAALALAASIAAGVEGELPRAVAVPLAALFALLFAFLVHRHGGARRAEREQAVRQVVSARGAARVRRDWDALPAASWPPADAALPPLATDLDLAGRRSLAQLLDVVAPATGGARLFAWLVAAPPDAATIGARQAAVAEAAGRPLFLESCAAAAEAARRVSPRTLRAFVAWAEAPAPAGPVRTLGILGRLGAGLTVLAVALQAAGRGGALLLTGVLVANVIVAGVAGRRLRGTMNGLADLPSLLRPALALMELYEHEPLAAACWGALKARLREGGGQGAVRGLERLVAWGEVRYSPMGHWLLNALVAWDALLLERFEAWRRERGATVEGWVDALADAEALTALATLAHDNPGWCFPELMTGDAGPLLEAEGLGHPLLPPDRRVGNPVHLGPAGSLLLVTGSNMAGKTTLLRSIGVNVLLAQAGGPACAVRMRWRRARVRTSIHVQDALGEGVSLYLAELRRLKEVVDAAAARDGGAPVLYLLDEVLHGTNSADRRTATRAVLARLSRVGAVGVVTTHDLELADEPSLARATELLHFREQYERTADGPRMTFDYVARPGKATSANALALLAVLGLDE